jgi:ATP-dependent Clp protease protease subunit
MSEKVPDTAISIWNAQNNLLLDYGIDVVNRSFCMSGDIDENTFAIVDQNLSLLERDVSTRDTPIVIKLNSLGGSIYNAWAVVSRIKSSPCPITIEAYGAVMSAATMIFAAGKKRRVSRYCEFMYHQGSINDASGTLNQMVNTIKSMKREEIMYCNFLQANSKKSSLFWRKLLHSNKDVFLSAEQIVKLGIAEEIF